MNISFTSARLHPRSISFAHKAPARRSPTLSLAELRALVAEMVG